MRLKPLIALIGAAEVTSTSQLVVETVSVKDKSGKGIEGLTAKDFTITEDGIPQKISFLEYQTLPEATEPPLPVVPARGIPVDKIARVQISPEPVGTTKYRDRRLLAMY